jgi:hypothetical protein
MNEEIEAWMLEAGNGGTACLEYPTSIHLDELDARYRDPTRWEEGILECLRSALPIRARLGLPCEVTVGLPIGRPLGRLELHHLSIAKLVELRTRTPPLLCLFPYGRESWMEVVRDYKGRCTRARLLDLELHLCDWWDADDERQVGGVWISAGDVQAPAVR